MDRNALLLYLENVRDLEVARNIVGRMYNIEKNIYETKIKEINEKKSSIYKINDFKYQPRGGCFVISVFMFILYAFCGIACIFIPEINAIFPQEWGVVLSIIGAGFFFLMMKTTDSGSRKNQEKAYNKQIDEIRKNNELAFAENAKISKSIESLHREWLKKDKFYKNEYAKITGVLQGFYAMNIVPKQYRNTSAAIYLYDFMSSSHESFQMALISNQIEDGIRRIEAKLDTLIELVRGNIIETRLLREENRQRINMTIDQNNRMLRHFEAIESNTNEASQYAKLASNYSKANAYFSLARYLDRR